MTRIILQLFALIALVMCSRANTASAKGSFDPYALTPKYFSARSHNQTSKERDGSVYRVIRTKFICGLELSVKVGRNNVWVKHGRHFSIRMKRNKIDAVLSHTDYSKGMKQGEHREFGKRGETLVITRYVGDKRQGVAEKYRSDGSLAERGTYQRGKKHGTFTTFHHAKKKKQGPKLLVTPYESGKKHGKRVQYDATGKIVYWAIFKSGKRIETGGPKNATKARIK